MKNYQENKVRWVLIRHYWKSMKRWFPVWVSYKEMGEYSFIPATEFEKERFGCCIKTSQIMAFEEQVHDKTTGFWAAEFQLKKDQKESQNKAICS